MKTSAYPALGIFLTLLPCVLSAQNSAPDTKPIVHSIPAARDTAYPGVINLFVDASDNARGIFRVSEKIPVVGPGPLVVLYPKWLPGNHSDTGQISHLAGLKINGGGRAIPWRRDPVDVFAFHLDVPSGVSEIEAQFEYLAPTDAAQGRIVTTPDMLNLQWTCAALYPAGFFVRRITVDAAVKLPEGWKAATALDVAENDGATIKFKQVTFDTLIDSPIFAGANVRVESLSPRVRLDIVADQPEQLAASEEQLQLHRNLVTQAVKLFGSEHYDHYDFLLSLSARQGPIGLEHHRSSEDGVTGGYFTQWKDNVTRRELLPHEYTHSWNGKFRRPADLWTPDYRTPMQGSLLWVYEGQTEFWGFVLGARSGLLTKEDVLGAFASIAARLDTDPGRKWRALEDTTDDPVIAQRRPKGWRNWQRSEDYYFEGALIWLDADSLIREQSHGARSLDDFARAFFGSNEGDWGEVTYTFDDVVRALNQTQPYDWASFLHARVDQVRDHAPLDGITRGGYQLIYTNTPSEWFKAAEKTRKSTDFSYSGGFILGKEGEVTEVTWDGPAFNAGLTVGAKIIAVDSRALDVDELKSAIKARKSPLQLLIKTGDIYRTLSLNYDGGLRYPMLVKSNSESGALDALLTPKP